jgi:hypothetical protein
MMIISMLVGAVAAYWVYNDARGRGHDLGTALLWSVGTVAALFIFLPLYLLVGRKSPVKQRPSADIIDIEATLVEGETIKCPMCAGRIKEEFKVCPYCGFTLKPACPSCGKELNREWRVCPYCQTATEVK